MKYLPKPYQQRAIDFICEHAEALLFLDMGLGKTVCTLTAFYQLWLAGESRSMIVVAPKQVAEGTWAAEVAKWAHLQGLRVSEIKGTARQRQNALTVPAEIYVVSRDNWAWLCDYTKATPPADFLVIDELTSFKNSASQRFKAMRKMRRTFRRVVGLTGTPAPNGLKDLWAQVWCADMGERLGSSKTRYENKYFEVFRYNGIPMRYTPRPHALDDIMNAIGDISVTMKAADYLEMPPLSIIDVPVKLDAKVIDQYHKFEKELVLNLDETPDTNIIANGAASLINKLAQMADGNIYDDEHNAIPIHESKLTALMELIEAAVPNHVLVFYRYTTDAEKIMAALKSYTVRRYRSADDLNDWNAGEIDVLLCHPSSTAYGLNLQQGGHYIVWYGLTWDLELYQQANARLYRQGQRYPVFVYRLIAEGTVDERIAASLGDKGRTQDKLLNMLKDIRKSYSISD